MNARPSAGRKDDVLGLGTIIVGSLPATLFTDDAPDRYLVEAAFNRKPQREEIEAILGNETRTCLSDNGYRTVEVSVSDRRLGIANTCLEELRDGLGAVLAERLAVISTEVGRRREIATARFQEASERERERAAAVAALADSVTFARRSTRRTKPHAAEDLALLAMWGDQGEAVRS
jgi:hypothetical protein